MTGEEIVLSAIGFGTLIGFGLWSFLLGDMEIFWFDYNNKEDKI